ALRGDQPGHGHQPTAGGRIAGDLAAGRPRPRPCDAGPLEPSRRPTGRARAGPTRPALRAGGPDAVCGRDLFWGVATLVAVEPTSLTLLECNKTGDRSGAAWRAVLGRFAQLELVISDAA